MLGESFIGQVIDLFGVFVQAEQCLFLYVIPEFGASHGWLVVTNAVCCSDWLFFPVDNLVWGKHFAKFFFCVRPPGAA